MYLTELRLHWRHLLAAGIGVGVGNGLMPFTTGLFAPALLAEFGWSKADFALIGSISLLYLPFIPVAGRFVDRFGSKIAAAIGFGGVSFCYILLASVSANLALMFSIYLLLQICAIFTTGLVFTRIIVQHFDQARGVALSLAMTFPPLVGALAAPALGFLIGEYGWRVGCLLLASITIAGGILSLAMMGARRLEPGQVPASAKLTFAELIDCLREPVLLLIIGGIFLVNIPAVIATSQLTLVVMSSGLSSEYATWLASLYALGVLAGRIVCGLALDRMAAHRVAFIALGIPAIGYAVLAMSAEPGFLLTLSVAFIGLAQGAETDLATFLISRHFPMRNYSLFLSFVFAMIIAGTAVGALLLNITLTSGDSYGPFFCASAIATLIGATLFALTGRRQYADAVGVAGGAGR